MAMGRRSYQLTGSRVRRGQVLGRFWHYPNEAITTKRKADCGARLRLDVWGAAGCAPTKSGRTDWCVVVLNLNPHPFKKRKGAAPKCHRGVEVRVFRLEVAEL